MDLGVYYEGLNCIFLEYVPKIYISGRQFQFPMLHIPVRVTHAESAADPTPSPTVAPDLTTGLVKTEKRRAPYTTRGRQPPWQRLSSEMGDVAT